MGLRLNTNVQALNAHRNLTKTDSMLNKSLERLSSGLRINKAADDASGLAIADNLKAQHKGLGQAIANANDGVNILQIADGALEESINIVNTIRTKSIQAASDGQNADSRAAIQADVDKLLEELNMISESTAYNGINLLDGSFTDKQFHVGAYKGETAKISIGNASGNVIGSMAYAKSDRAAEAAVSKPFYEGDSVSKAALEDGDLRINGIDIDATQAQHVSSASEFVVDVTAVGTTNFTINGVTIADSADDAALIANINNNSEAQKLGIRAEDDGSGHTKIISDFGENLKFENITNVQDDSGAALTEGQTESGFGGGIHTAQAKAAAINAKVNETGVQAKAITETTLSGFSANTAMTINGSTIAAGAAGSASELVDVINNSNDFAEKGIKAELVTDGANESVKIIGENGQDLDFTDTNAVTVDGIGIATGADAGFEKNGKITFSNATAMTQSTGGITESSLSAGDLTINGVDVAQGGSLAIKDNDSDGTLLNAINNNSTFQKMGVRAEYVSTDGGTTNRIRIISENDKLEIGGTDPGKMGFVKGTTEGINTNGIVLEGSATDTNKGADNYLAKIGFSGSQYGASEGSGVNNQAGNDKLVLTGSFLKTDAVSGTALKDGSIKINGVDIDASQAQHVSNASEFIVNVNGGDTGDFTINGITIADSADNAALINNINNNSEAQERGIRAEDDGSGSVKIISDFGENLKFENITHVEDDAGNGLTEGQTESGFGGGMHTAQAKAAAINAKVNETGVQAKAITETIIDATAGGVAAGGMTINGQAVADATTNQNLVNSINNSDAFKGLGIKAELITDGTNESVKIIGENGQDLAFTGLNNMDVNGMTLGGATSFTQHGELVFSKAGAMVGTGDKIEETAVNGGDLVINGVDIAAGGSLNIKDNDSDGTLLNAINDNAELQQLGIRAEYYSADGGKTNRIRLISDKADITISGTDPGKLNFVKGTTEANKTTGIKIEGSATSGNTTIDDQLAKIGLSGSVYGASESDGVDNTAGNDALTFGTDRMDYKSGDISINGYSIGEPTDDGLSEVLGDRSAAAWADAINRVSGETGVEADIVNAEHTGAGIIKGGVLKQGDIKINGVDIIRDNKSGSGMEIKDGDAGGTLVDAINEYKDETGVMASLDDQNRLVLTARDGRNIHVETTANGNKLSKIAADFGETGVAQDSVFMGNVRLVSDESFTVEGTGSNASERELSLGKAGFAGGGSRTDATSDMKGDGKIISGLNYDTSIANVDVTTQEGAEMAIRTADYALKRLDEIRSGLGSTQNQLTSTISNLSVTQVNVQATESAIRDVDFAAESTQFSKMQVLMQAGTYAQSQANASAQNVMRLLQ